MARAILTPEEAVKLRSLWRQYKAALDRSLEAAETEGMESAAFKEAHDESGEARRKIRELLGTTGQHWME
jgi:hypothetical protein